MSHLSSVAPSILAAFFASLVEFVEALTVVLAVGTTRGWASAVAGAVCGVGLLLVLVAALGPLIAFVPLHTLQILFGTLLLLFGMRWLRKAILRSAGIIALHDEAATFTKETARLRALGSGRVWDSVAMATAFQITVLEGMEVVFIVLAIGSGGPDLMLPAGLGALLALLVVIGLGVALHRPLASMPENILKFGVGVLLCGFSTFWIGEGLGVVWPIGDATLFALCIGFLIAASLMVPFVTTKVTV